MTHSRTINQTLQSINNNNNNNTTIAKSKIHLNVDQQISADTSYKEDDSSLNEPNNNTKSKTSNSSSSSSSRSCYRHHPVSRRGTEFISQQVPGFRSFSGNNKYITQKNKQVQPPNLTMLFTNSLVFVSVILGINRRRNEVNPRAKEDLQVVHHLVAFNNHNNNNNKIQTVNKHLQPRVPL